jgi:hypothetical protein
MFGLLEVSPGVYKTPDWQINELEKIAPVPRLRGRKPQDNGFMRALLAGPIDAHLRRHAFNLPDQTTAQGYVKLRAYAQDRLVLTAGRSSLSGGRRAAKWLRVKPSLRCISRLERRAESRRTWQVGGRTRHLPQKTRFSTYGRNFVRDAAHLVERDGQGRASFLTFTFAGGTQAGYDVMSAASGYICDRLNRWLRYKVHGGEFVYIWELQERGAPHLHYLFRWAGQETGDDLRDLCQAEWRKILLEVSADSGTDLFARLEGGSWRDDPQKPFVDCKPVDWGYAQYMSKYMSKTKSKGGRGHTWVPGRWWAVSAPLRVKVLAERLTVELTFPSEEAAKLAVSRLIQTASDIISNPWIADRAAVYGCLTVSADTPVMLARAIVEALAELARDGDLTRLRELDSSLQPVRHLLE